MKEGISILIAAYNAQDYIEECLTSIQNQTYFKDHKNYEIIIGIDGCESTLNKVKEIKDNYSNLRVFYMHKNKGAYITHNTLLDKVSYDYILKFDADDIMLPNMIEVLKKITSYDIIRFMCKKYYTATNTTDREIPKYPDGTLMMRHNVIEKSGGYMPWYMAADTEFLHRVKDHFKILYLNEILFLRRIHNESLCANLNTNFNSGNRQHYKEMIKMYDRIPNRPLFIDRVINENYEEI